MSPLAVTALILASVWMAALTIIAALLVRQVALLTGRIDPDYALDGLTVGRRIPSWIGELLPGESGGLLVLGAGCAPCEQLVHELSGFSTSQGVVAVVEGKEASISPLVEELPSDFRILSGERAERATSELKLETTPFLFLVDRREIVEKAIPRSAHHLLSLLQTPELVTADASEAQKLEVSHVG